MNKLLLNDYNESNESFIGCTLSAIALTCECSSTLRVIGNDTVTALPEQRLEGVGKC